MKIKWKCILYRLVLPSAIAITTAVTLILLSMYLLPLIFPPQPFNETEWIQSSQPITDYHEPIIPIPFILLMAFIGFILTWIKNATKPCVIKEHNLSDTIASGVSTIIDMIIFGLIILLIFAGILCVFGAIVVTPGYIIFSLLSFGCAYFLFPNNSSLS